MMLYTRASAVVFVSLLFQRDDDAPVHKAAPETNDFPQFGVDECEWPAQSSDLNPILHLQRTWITDCEPDPITDVSVGPH